MGALVIRGLLTRKLRSVLTAIAIVLGVAMISGTFVLTDQISGAFDNIFQAANKGTDAVVKPSPAFGSENNANDVPLYVPESLVARVQAGAGRARGRRGDHRERLPRRRRQAREADRRSSADPRVRGAGLPRQQAPRGSLREQDRSGARSRRRSAARGPQAPEGRPAGPGRDVDRAAPRSRLGDHQVPRVGRGRVAS